MLRISILNRLFILLLSHELCHVSNRRDIVAMINKGFNKEIRGLIK